ncbi:MAG TPA: Fe-S cluster assembly ATPase SufC [Actinomycetota bacterium]|nr:Fe-S cluster assembly ATPase SufC [Actinomycetota bacterium]
MSLLEIHDLHVTVEDKPILRGVDLVVDEGKVHALMGPNGSGKSTLASVLMGHPAFEITGGRIVFKGEDITEDSPEDRAAKGVFLAFQYPVEVPGVSVSNFLRTSINAVRGTDVPIREFMQQLREAMELLGMDPDFAKRSINEGFSGGEKKRNEILQLALLRPALAILDETDSGLDIDALRIVSEAVNKVKGPDMGILIITHYTRILNYITPDVVHILLGGRVVRTGGPELAHHLEEAGYEAIRAEYGIDTDEAVTEKAQG